MRGATGPPGSDSNGSRSVGLSAAARGPRQQLIFDVDHPLAETRGALAVRPSCGTCGGNRCDIPACRRVFASLSPYPMIPASTISNVQASCVCGRVGVVDEPRVEDLARCTSRAGARRSSPRLRQHQERTGLRWPAREASMAWQEPQVRFDTKIAVLLRDDLEGWQRLNVCAFLISGIAAANPRPSVSHMPTPKARVTLRCSRQPVLVFAGQRTETMHAAHERALTRDMPVGIFTSELFTTGNDRDNRAAVRAVSACRPRPGGRRRLRRAQRRRTEATSQGRAALSSLAV